MRCLFNGGGNSKIAALCEDYEVHRRWAKYIPFLQHEWDISRAELHRHKW